MKIFKKTLSLVVTLSVLLMTFSFMFTMPISTAFAQTTDWTLANTTTLTFNVTGKGWSGTNGYASTLSQVDDTEVSGNKYMQLSTPNSSGYNMELASSNTSNTAYILTASTKYVFKVKFKVLSGQGELLLCYGTQAAHNGDYAKPVACTWKAVDYSDNQWHTVSVEKITTDTMTADSYGSSKTNLCNRLYLVATASASSFAIDEVIIEKYTQGEVTPDTGDDTNPTTKYTISDFDYAPYSSIGVGTKSGQGYASYRFYTDTVDSNRVLGYHYMYNIDQSVSGSAADSGTRGNLIGHNYSGVAGAAIVTSANTPYTIESGKAYRVSLKYKVTAVEDNNYVCLSVIRGKFQKGWAESYNVGTLTAAKYIIAKKYSVTSNWIEESLTFLADYTTATDYNVLQIGGSGFGNVLIDDITVEEISPEDVVEKIDEAVDFTTSFANGKLVLDSYLGSDENLTIKPSYNSDPTGMLNDYFLLYDRHVKNLTIEEGILTIGKSCFQQARVLETVTIPQSVTSIGKIAFYGIPTLTAINVNANNANYVTVNGVLYNKDMTELIAYPAAKSGTSFIVPDSVLTIAEGAFYGAKNLVSITLPDNLTSIGRRAFMNCTALTTINIPAGVNKLEASTFRDCSSLATDTFLISDTTIIGENVFLGCDLLYTIGDLDTSSTSVGISDGTVLVRYLAGWTDIDTNRYFSIAADLNCDGSINLVDAAIIKRHLASWPGYETLPLTNLNDKVSDTYSSSSTTPELVVNLSENKSQLVTSNRDIEYDPTKEDLIIILATGQSNGTSSVGYYYENATNKKDPTYQITEATDRPSQGTVFSGTRVTELTINNDVWRSTDHAAGNMLGGYTPALGKALNEATGAKVAIIQAAKGAVGLHEWTPEPEKYNCNCSSNGKNMLYLSAIRSFTMSYQELDEDYNIIATAYVYCQEEHEEGYQYLGLDKGNTIRNHSDYEAAYMEMHNGFLSDCQIDMGGMFLPRSFYKYAGSGAADTVEHSRRPTYARAAQIAAANKHNNLFLFSNFTDNMSATGPYTPDPTNDIHYSQIVYNRAGRQTADSILKYFGMKKASTFTGISVFDYMGNELCTFDENGNLLTGSDIVSFGKDTLDLYIRIEPTGTLYNYELTCAGTNAQFVDDYAVLTEVEGQSTYKIVINPPVK